MEHSLTIKGMVLNHLMITIEHIDDTPIRPYVDIKNNARKQEFNQDFVLAYFSGTN